MDYQKRNLSLREKLLELELEGILITCPENIFYLTGAINTEGILLLHKEGEVFFTDFRYFDALLASQLFFDIVQCKSLIKDIADLLKKKGFKKLGFESGHLSVDMHRRLKEALADIVLSPCVSFVEDLRMIKDAQELGLIQNSAQILGAVMDKVPQMVGQMRAITERDLAIELDYSIKKEGAQKSAFDIIVATGKRSAYPHSSPADCRINTQGPLLVDCGAVYKGYHSDMTRVMATEGSTSERIKEIYTIVRQAQEAAMQTVCPGTLAKDVDLAARQLIEKAGFKDQFGHGTGHGIGLKVHEEPKIDKKSETVLKPGMVFTIEPGIYLQNEFGIRWEDMILVTKDGYQSLTSINWDSLMPI